MDSDLCHELLKKSPIGQAYCRRTYIAEGQYDYELIDSNIAFANCFAAETGFLPGQKLSEVPDSNKWKEFWRERLEKTKIQGGCLDFEYYISETETWLKVFIFETELDHLVIQAVDVSEERKKIKTIEDFFAINLDLLCIADVFGNFVKLNKKWEEVLGYPAEELEGKPFLDYVHEDDRAATLEALRQLNRQERVLNFVNRYRCKDGSYRFIEWSTQPNGELVYAAARDITLQLETEAALLESEKNFRVFFETLTDMIFIAERDGTILYANEAAFKKLGYEKTELYAKHVLEVHPSECRIEAESIFNEMLAGRAAACYLPLQKKDGKKIAVETRIWLGEWNGRPCIFGISKDVSKEQAAFQKFNKVFNENPLMMMIASVPERRALEVNRKFLDVLGLELDEVIGRTSQELGVFADENVLEGMRRKLQEDGKIVNLEVKIRGKNGEMIEGLLSNERIEAGEEEYYLSVLTDVTELRAMQERLKRVGDRLILATKAGGVGIWEYDIITGVLSWDEEMFRLYGVNKEDFSNAYEAWVSGLHPADRARCEEEVRLAIEGVKEFETEFRVCKPDGAVRYIKVFSLVQRDAEGKALRMIGTNWDISERKEIEMELLELNLRLQETVREAEAANKAKSIFLANMSHEIRTPMNGILGFMQLLENTRLNDEQAEFLRMMKFSAEMLLNVINDILDVSKIEAGKFELEEICFELQEVVNGCMQAFSPKAREKLLRLEVEMAKEIPRYLIGDPTRLKQVLGNLLSNAIKFTAHGFVRLEMSCSEAELHFAVCDSGIGISDVGLKKLFQPFSQAEASAMRNYGGSGLGLTICKAIIEKMGGRIEVQSEPGVGSRFSFRIPLRSAKREAVSEFKEYALLKGKKVLLIEGNVSEREMGRMFLEEAGCLTEEAESFAAALVKLLQPSAGWSAVLLACDEKEAGGYELAAALKVIAATQKLPLVLIANGVVSEEKRSLFEAFLRKPYLRKDLWDCLLLLFKSDRGKRRKVSCKNSGKRRCCWLKTMRLTDPF